MKHLRRQPRTKLNQKAFTIVELMIATSVLSVILLLVTVMMISIGDLYYKGINQARVQDNVRNITDEVAQQLQLSDQLPVTPLPAKVINLGGGNVITAYCIGPTRYSYVTNLQIGSGSGQITHVLWRDITPAAGCVPADLRTALSGGAELIASNSRLTGFSISLASPYTVSIGVAFGDSDLLTLNGLNTTCNDSTGDQFCATASLTTTAGQRITGS